eukprot:12486996-Alexandrium_andersonii.AAC.1
MADALPRQRAPDAKAFPEELASVQRTIVPVCDSRFCHHLLQREAQARLLPYSRPSRLHLR